MRLSAASRGTRKLRLAQWEKLHSVLGSLARARESRLPVSGASGALCFEQGFKFSPVSQSVAAFVCTDRWLQEACVLRAFHRLHLPPKDLDFIFTCLWKKLRVGKRLHAIFPIVPSTCPVNGAAEDVYHRTKACTWLTVPLRILQCTFAEVTSSAGRAPMSGLCSDYLALSLSCAFGLLLWKTVRVLWTYRCFVAFRSEAPQMDAFFRILHSDLASWAAVPDLSISHTAVSLYMHAIERWLSDRDILMLYLGLSHAKYRQGTLHNPCCRCSVTQGREPTTFAVSAVNSRLSHFSVGEWW